MSENNLTVERTPEIIALELRALSNQFRQLALSYAIEIGRKLCEAKALVEHGEWGGWLKEKTEFGKSTAEYLMRIFKEYGADQVSFLGDAKSQTLGNLSYTKALKLLDIPAEEREDFAIENDVEHISTRKLDELIKERDEAKKRAAEAEASEEGAALKLADMEEAIDGLKEQLEEKQRVLDTAKQLAEEAQEESERLEGELKKLQARPIDVAVMEADPAVIDQARTEAAAEARKKTEEELKLKIQKAKDDQKKAEDKLESLKKDHEAEVKKLKEELEKTKAGKNEQNNKELESLKSERDDALAKAAQAEKALAVADPGLTQFKVIYEEAQGMLNKLVGMLMKAEPEKRDGLRKALSTMLSAYGEKIKDGAA